MTADDSPELVEKAVAGDAAALELLLLRLGRRLTARVERRLPGDLRGLISAEDVLQEAFVDVFRDIGKFEDRGQSAFFRWVATVVEHRLLDIIKAQRAEKRGGGGRRITATHDDGTSLSDADLVDLLHSASVRPTTPSRFVARREATDAVLGALNDLKADYRDALRLRFMDGLPIADVAVRLGKTEPAVHKLLQRGLASLRDGLGNSAQFFTRK